MQYLGTPYVYGGASPGGFDCSGFVMYVFNQIGVSLPHNAAAQYGYGMPVSRDQLQPGDLVFFNGLGHVGIYIGGGQMIHSPHTGDVVKISSLSGWYASTYVGATPQPGSVPPRAADRPPASGPVSNTVRSHTDVSDRRERLSFVELLEFGREVLLADAALELQRRRDLVLLG